ncbi:UNVERIFIED_CONTAM: hypothetical protein GTU68_010661 [Idotea baltica]|nr:hypothetical protein [Idotea baltica]
MAVEGGSWIWSASLRFYFMVPLLLIIVGKRGNLQPLMREMKSDPWQWLLWSTIGFGIFYGGITFASNYGPSWLVASTWQVVIIAGILLAPLINKKDAESKISPRAIFFSLIILSGVALMQISQATAISLESMFLGTVPVLIAAFAYPLGNRMMMKVTGGRIDSYQRTLGMTLASLPFWILLSTIGLLTVPNPSTAQIYQTLIVAICSGVIATSLFFRATDLARNDAKLLASVESTQAAEVIFAVIGEIILLQSELPDIYSIIGMCLVILGMILHSVKRP